MASDVRRNVHGENGPTTWVSLFTEDCRFWIPTRMTVPVRERIARSRRSTSQL